MPSQFQSSLLRADIVGGAGAVARIGDWLAGRGIARPLVIAGARVARTELFASCLASVREGGCLPSVAEDVPSPATAPYVESLALRHAAERWDALVAVGGGSTLDSAKALALLIARGGAVSDHAIARGAPPAARVDAARVDAARFLPFAAVPTTLSGSEANGNASIREPASGARHSLADPGLLPSLVVLDPRALRSHRPEVLLGSAFNALAHCIEGIYSRRHHLLADAQARTAGALLCSVLERPAAPMTDDALLGLQAGSVLAGSLIREVYVGMHHAMCHALVSLCGVLHAQANGALLPWTVGFNVDALAGREPDRLAAVAATIGMREGATAAAIRQRLERLQAQASIPARLADLGVGRESLSSLVDHTLHDRALDTNPVAVGRSELLAVFEQAL